MNDIIKTYNSTIKFLNFTFNTKIYDKFEEFHFNPFFRETLSSFKMKGMEYFIFLFFIYQQSLLFWD